MRRTLVGVFVAAVLLADAGSTLASVVRLDRCRSGYFDCDVSGKVHRPRQIVVAIGSRPVGTFDADWNTVCFKWSGHKRRHGTFKERSSFKKRIAHAMAYWRPDRCEVEVQVFSGVFPQPDSGRMKLLLKAHV